MTPPRSKSADAPLEIRVSNLTSPFAEVQAALARSHPKAGIVGVGIGKRRRRHRHKQRDRGHPTRALALKVMVREKRDEIDDAERLPRSVVLVGSVLGRRVRIRMRTDIDAAPPVRLTRYRIEITPNDDLTVGCYATWDENGVRRVGGVTAGHALWSDAGHTQLRSTVSVDGLGSCAGRSFPVSVLAASHLKNDGVDVGLVALPTDAGGGLDACFKSLTAAPVRLLLANELAAMLGSDSDGSSLDSYYRHYVLAGSSIAATAYWDALEEIALPDWQFPTMRELVEWEGPDGSFAPGVSGSSLLTVSLPEKDCALGLQSFSRTDDQWRQGFGTSAEAALRWLRATVSPSLELRWPRP